MESDQRIDSSTDFLIVYWFTGFTCIAVCKRTKEPKSRSQQWTSRFTLVHLKKPKSPPLVGSSYAIWTHDVHIITYVWSFVLTTLPRASTSVGNDQGLWKGKFGRKFKIECKCYREYRVSQVILQCVLHILSITKFTLTPSAYLDWSNANFIPPKFNFDSPMKVQVFLCFLHYFTHFDTCMHKNWKRKT